MRQRNGRTRRCGQRGFTLIEQMLVAAIVAALACLAVPALGSLTTRSRLQTAQSDLYAALQRTRALAVHSGRRAMLCPTRDGQQCSDELHWEGGWLVGHFRSDNADQLDGAPTLAGPSREQLTIVTSTGRRRARFQADGTSGGSTITFTICRTGRADDALSVVISLVGRIRANRANSSDAASCASGG